MVRSGYLLCRASNALTGWPGFGVPESAQSSSEGPLGGHERRTATRSRRVAERNRGASRALLRSLGPQRRRVDLRGEKTRTLRMGQVIFFTRGLTSLLRFAATEVDTAPALEGDDSRRSASMGH